MTACPACGQPAPTPVEIALVRVPLRTVSGANAREHHQVRARRVKEERETTEWSLRAMQPRTVRAVQGAVDAGLIVRLTRVAPRELDDDNVRSALKGVRDQVAEWLGLASDRDPRVAWVYLQRRGHVGEYAVEISFARRGRP